MAKIVALVWDNDKAYFFKGDEYIRYDIAADQADEGYPQSIGGHRQKFGIGSAA